MGHTLRPPASACAAYARVNGFRALLGRHDNRTALLDRSSERRPGSLIKSGFWKLSFLDLT